MKKNFKPKSTKLTKLECDELITAIFAAKTEHLINSEQYNRLLVKLETIKDEVK